MAFESFSPPNAYTENKLEKEIPTTPELIFENQEAIRELLSTATLIKGEELGEIRPEIAGTHSNKVFMTELIFDKDANSSNSNRLFEILYGEGNHIQALFKPFSGERPSRKREFEIATSFYAREVAASIIDQYAGFNVVLPTIERTIDGEIGSLQLYLPPEIADVPKRVDEEIKIQAFKTEYWKIIAVLDVLISNRDRNKENYLIYKDGSGVAAIDHGCSYCMGKEGDANDAYNAFAGNPKWAELTPHIRSCLERLIENAEELIEDLPEDVAFLTDMDEYNPVVLAQKMLEANSIVIES